MRDEKAALWMFFGGGLGSIALLISNIYFNGLPWIYATPAGVIVMLLICVIGYLGAMLPGLKEDVRRIEDGVWRASVGEPVPMSEKESDHRLSQMKIPGE